MVLNASLGVLVSVCIVTGLPIWLEWSDVDAWALTHTITGFLSLMVMLAHLG